MVYWGLGPRMFFHFLAPVYPKKTIRTSQGQTRVALLISSSALLPNSVLVAFSESGHLNSRNVFFWFDVEPSLGA